MKITVSQLKQGLVNKTGGRALANISNLYPMIQETLFQMSLYISLPSAIRKVPFINPLLSDPYLWKAPQDMSLEGVIDIYKKDFVNNEHSQRYGAYSTEFMKRYVTGFVNVEHIDGDQYLRFKDTIANRVQIDSCEDSTNGSWTPVGTTQNIRYTDTYSVEGKKSVVFDVGATSSLFGIYKDNFKDIANIKDKKYLVFGTVLPIDMVNGLQVRVGKDASNYRYATVTRDYEGKRLTKGYHLIMVDLSTASINGSYNPTLNPTDDDVNYFYLGYTETITTLTNDFRIDNILALDDIQYVIEYYSLSVTFDQYGVRRNSNLIEADTDYLMLNEHEYLLFLRQFSVISGVDIRPASANTEITVYGGGLSEMYQWFRENYPSRKIINSSDY